jgi:UDP-GlcNAc:undecaprenyl-phosphate/decaprenyl-phosphate GlcNAc-1-phosphate transferase
MSLAILAVTAFVLTLLATPVCRAVCLRCGWVDQPDPRKLHRGPIPRTGGIAIFLGYAAALLLFRFSPIDLPRSLAGSAQTIGTILPAVLVAFATGLLDDLADLKPWMKLSGQVLAALLVCVAGVQIRGLGGYSILGQCWQIPLTVFWLVGCANAFNLIDGLDGLAAGVGLFATATAFLSALLSGNYALTLVTAPLLGALLGFLPFNFNPASIFMGDCGSNTVGFLLGCFAIIWSQKSATLLGMTAPLIALAIPLLDTALAIARRFLRNQDIFGADRGHIHHRLLSRGFTPRRVAYVLYASAGVLAVLSVMLTIGTYRGDLVLLAFCIIVCLAIHYLGYEEFESARRILFGDVFRHSLNADLLVRQLEAAIQSAASVEECWVALQTCGRSFGVSRATMHVHGRKFTAQLLEGGTTAECWSLSIPLNGAGTIDLQIPFRPDLSPASAVPLATSLRMVLAPKLETFHLKASRAGAD